MSSSLSTLADLLTRFQFVAGLIAGMLGLATLWLLRRRHSPTWAFVAVTATMVAAHVAYGRRLGVVAGLASLALGGFLVDRGERWSSPLGWSFAATGAVVVSIRGGLGEGAWILGITPIVILLGGVTMQRWKGMPEARGFGVLVAITSFGIWATVPNTDVARVLLGVSSVMAIATFHRDVPPVSGTGAFALAGLIAWAGATGGVMRHGSIIGAWGCFALLVLWPVVKGRLGEVGVWPIVASHSAMVLVSSRVFGLWDTGLAAAVGVLTLGLTTVAASHMRNRVAFAERGS